MVPEHGKVAARIEAGGIGLRIIPLPPIRPWNVFRIIKSVSSHAHLAKEVDAQLIYANGSRAAFYGGLAARMSRRPLIWHCRIGERDIYLDPIITRLSDFIIANSNFTALRFKKELTTKVKVIHNGVDLEWLREEGVERPVSISKDWKLILMVARVSRGKHHDLAVAAFEQIASSDSAAHLVFVGAQDPMNSEWYRELQMISRRSAFRDRIHWIGHVEDVRSWYRAAYVLLLAAENEAFGRVLVEAMACGVPVVAVRSGGAPEIVRDGRDGLLVPKAEAVGIANAIMKIIKDNALRSRFSESARERAEYFQVTKYVQGVMRVFEETLIH